MEANALANLKNRGKQLYAAGEYSQAADNFSQYLGQDPTASDVWCLLGFAEIGKHNYNVAESSLLRACELDPFSAESLFGLGSARLANLCLDEAIQNFEEALEIQGDHKLSKKLLSQALLLRSQRPERHSEPILVEIDLKRAWDLDPKNLQITLAYLNHLNQHGSVGRTKLAISRAMQLHPSNADIGALARESGVTLQQLAVVYELNETEACAFCEVAIQQRTPVCPNCRAVLPHPKTVEKSQSQVPAQSV